MIKHTLSDIEIQNIMRCIEEGTEVPEDLLPKLNPSFFDKLAQENKFDFQKLEKYKIPTIEYAGKRSEALIVSQAGLMGGGSPLQVERCFQAEKQTESVNTNEWKNLLVQGDNLQFLKTCFLNQDPLIKDKVKGKIKLIYIDPPFATKSDFRGKEGESSYADKVDRAEFLEALRERLIFLRELLAEDGSIYVHLDQKMSHYMKVIMDEVFGKDCYRNEIVWHYETGGIPEKFYAQKHDSILFYSRGAYYFNPSTLGVRRDQCEKCETQLKKVNNMKKGIDEAGRIYRSIKSAGKEYRYYDDDIVPPTDVWLNINQLQQKDPERINYPTQKPEKLLYRVIEASTKADELVLDCFAGSGTTSAVAEKLGRRWIACDFGKHSIYTIQKRILEIGNSKKLGKDAKKDEKYEKPPNPFCIVSVGAYDFQRIMSLRENTPAYIDFVLSLFAIADRAPIKDGEYTNQYANKHRVSNIYAQKDGNPVEVFPIWQDDYLRHIKIDEEYLQGIITQSGGKLKGKYYIIAPETCDAIGDITIGETEFIILSFPYKILEEASRNFELTEQPSSADNINNLVSSVGFYFNEQVDIGLERIPNGLKVVRFVTPILNKEKNHFTGFEGLAMLLIDKDYDGTTFRMEEAVYNKSIAEDGTFAITDLTDKVAVIAIDKHGNESKLVIIT